MRTEFIILAFVLAVAAGSLLYVFTRADVTGLDIHGEYFGQVLISKNYFKNYHVYCYYWDYDLYDAWGNYQPTPCYTFVRQEGVACDPPSTYDPDEQYDGYFIAKPCSGGLTHPMSGIHNVYRRTLLNYYR